MAATAATLAAMICGPALSGCGSTGQCTVVCTFSSDGRKSYHGPYDDYTEAECTEQAKQSASPSVITREPDCEPP